MWLSKSKSLYSVGGLPGSITAGQGPPAERTITAAQDSWKLAVSPP